MEAYDWIVGNVEWVLSGVGVSLIGWIARWLLKNRRSTSQSIRAGDRSINIIVGDHTRADVKVEKGDAQQN